MDEADKLCDRIAIVDHGKLVALDSPLKLKASIPGCESLEKTGDFLHGAAVGDEVEVYPAQHGWCVPDMPQDAGAPLYNMAEAERAWAKLLELYKTSLA